jgi:hypothetical protein
MRPIRRLFRGIQENTYAYLLAALVVASVSATFIHHMKFVGVIEDYLFLLVLFAAMYNVTRTRRHLVVGVVLGLPAIIARVFDAHFREPPVFVSALILISTVAFFSFLVWHILNDVLRGRRVTAEKITGAVCAYLLLGFVWALLYAFMEFIEPGSLAIPDALTERVTTGEGESALSLFTYYSFVTLTTLGYGDITPVSIAARTFAWIEALVGQLYLAIMIARLVGIHIAEAAYRGAAQDPENSG